MLRHTETHMCATSQNVINECSVILDTHEWRMTHSYVWHMTNAYVTVFHMTQSYVWHHSDTHVSHYDATCHAQKWVMSAVMSRIHIYLSQHGIHIAPPSAWMLCTFWNNGNGRGRAHTPRSRCCWRPVLGRQEQPSTPLAAMLAPLQWVGRDSTNFWEILILLKTELRDHMLLRHPVSCSRFGGWIEESMIGGWKRDLFRWWLGKHFNSSVAQKRGLKNWWLGRGALVAPEFLFETTGNLARTHVRWRL